MPPLPLHPKTSYIANRSNHYHPASIKAETIHYLDRRKYNIIRNLNQHNLIQPKSKADYPHPSNKTIKIMYYIHIKPNNTSKHNSHGVNTTLHTKHHKMRITITNITVYTYTQHNLIPSANYSCNTNDFINQTEVSQPTQTQLHKPFDYTLTFVNSCNPLQQHRYYIIKPDRLNRYTIAQPQLHLCPTPHNMSAKQNLHTKLRTRHILKTNSQINHQLKLTNLSLKVQPLAGHTTINKPNISVHVPAPTISQIRKSQQKKRHTCYTKVNRQLHLHTEQTALSMQTPSNNTSKFQQHHINQNKLKLIEQVIPRTNKLTINSCNLNLNLLQTKTTIQNENPASIYKLLPTQSAVLTETASNIRATTTTVQKKHIKPAQTTHMQRKQSLTNIIKLTCNKIIKINIKIITFNLTTILNYTNQSYSTYQTNNTKKTNLPPTSYNQLITAGLPYRNHHPTKINHQFISKFNKIRNYLKYTTTPLEA
eukprot:gene3461-2412_t